MKLRNILIALIVGVLLATIISACSKGESPVEPVIDNAPISFGAESENRSVLAVYNAVIDPDKKTFTVEPANRTAEYHFPLTQLYPDVLQITAYGWTPNFWADIKLVHPLPGSGIDAFDPRVIAILPANPGVSFNYPTFNVQANNSVILEPDGYTKMFDWINPSITGNANPFIAYFKEQSNRVWSSTVKKWESRRWQLDISGFGGQIQFVLVVDVSTNYPTPPQPVTDNALEPVQIQIEIGEGLTPTGGSATVTATFLDWQGPDEIKCKVEAPDFFNGAVQLFYTEPGPNPDEYIFTGTISNNLGTPYGSYPILIAAWDINVGNHLFIEAIAHVEFPFDPVDVTPSWLNLHPHDMFANDQYLYITGGYHGLHIFDISDSANPVWINAVRDDWGNFQEVFVSDGYAYVLRGFSGLEIIDIDPPESAYIVKHLQTSWACKAINVVGEYAYVALSYGIDIIDINPPEDAYIVNTVDTMDYVNDMSISNGYAMVTNDDGLEILDIDPPESAYSVGFASITGAVKNVVAGGGYAYVSDGYDELRIVDIDPPESPSVIKTIDVPHTLKEFTVLDGYVYIACGIAGLQIVDIDPPLSAHIAYNVATPQRANIICVGNGCAYVACNEARLEVIDIQPLDSAHIVNTIINTCNEKDLFASMDLYASDDYVYLANGYVGLQIINTNPPESAHLVNTIETPNEAIDVFVSDGYAYVADRRTGLVIVDIDPPESSYIVNTVYLSEKVHSVFVSDNYAYLTNYPAGEVIIIDINPPESAYIVNTVSTLGAADKIFVSGDYAYVTNHYSRFHILDISPPESAYMVKTVDVPGTPNGVYVTDGYAYIASKYDGLQIVDIDPLESAHVVNSVDTYDCALDVFVSGGYAFVADHHKCLSIISVTPPEYAYFVKSFDIHSPYFHADGIYLSNDYAYLACVEDGLLIIDLW